MRNARRSNHRPGRFVRLPDFRKTRNRTTHGSAPLVCRRRYVAIDEALDRRLADLLSFTMDECHLLRSA